jgi:hypothetical protein
VAAENGKTPGIEAANDYSRAKKALRYKNSA